MPLQSLTNLRVRLEHSLLALAEQDDVDGPLLRSEVRNLLNVILLMLDSPLAATPDRVPVVTSRGVSLIERVRAYAEREGIYLPSGTMSDTVVMDTRQILAALSAMKPGACEPPPELMPAIVEAFEGPSEKHDTLRAPTFDELLEEETKS